MILANHEDFVRAVDNILQQHLVTMVQLTGISWSPEHRQINRHLLNLLTVLRTFLDHSESELKRRYGRASDKVAWFKHICFTEYDNHFASRFLYKLRNHCPTLRDANGEFNNRPRVDLLLGPR